MRAAAGPVNHWVLGRGDPPGPTWGGVRTVAGSLRRRAGHGKGCLCPPAVATLVLKPARFVPEEQDARTMFTPCPTIVFGCLFPEKIDRFANGRIAKFNVRNDDAIHLVGHLRRAAHVAPSPFVVSDRADRPYFLTGCCQASSTFQRSRARVSLLRFFRRSLVFGVIDSFLSSTRSGVIWGQASAPGRNVSSPCRTGRTDKNPSASASRRFTSSTLFMKPGVHRFV